LIQFSDGLLWYVIFLFSTTFHEASHAFAAKKMGDLTAYENGQVSLSPFPHMKREPIGTIVVPIISFLLGGWMIGWANVPYDGEWAYNNPKKSAAMAAAGPSANFILVCISAILIYTGIYFNIFQNPETVNTSNIVEAVNPGVFVIVAKTISIFFSLNLLLFLFNLIPLPPLDGSGMIPMYLSVERGQRYLEITANRIFAIIGLLFAWKLFDHFHFKLNLLFINLLYWWTHYGR
jgi:Zn-dependent protease